MSAARLRQWRNRCVSDGYEPGSTFKPCTAIAALEEKGFEVVNTLFTDEWYSKEAMESRGVVQIPLCFLSKSLQASLWVRKETRC